MARKGKGIELEPKDPPAQPGEEQPVFVDDKGPADPGETTLVLEEDEPGKKGGKGPQSPGTETAARPGDGKGKERDLEEENENLKRALRESRTRGRQLMADLALARQAHSTEETRRKEQEEAGKRAKRLESLKDVDDLSEAATIIRDEVVEGHVRPQFITLRRSLVRLSQKEARGSYEDYDERLEKSGLVEAITVDPVTGQAKDPVLWKKIMLDSEDPGEDAYLVATELLREQGKLKPEEETDEDLETLDGKGGDRAAGRREVVDALNRNVNRPRGIGSLPGSGEEPATKRLTRKQIDAMTDAERARLPKAIIEEWLMGAP